MRRASGFSLIEVMVASLILTFVIAGISGVLMAQGQATVNQTQQRDIESNARLAALELARSVRLAGYGINPLAAFDFDRYACTTPGTATTCPNGGRDRINGPDEMVVSWRDPSFSRTVTAITGAGPWTVTLNAALITQLKAGRIVQMLCSGAEPSVYLAVNADTAAAATQLVLRALTAADGYYAGSTPTGVANTTPADGCFASATLMLVERVRYYVSNDTDGVPALFKERGRGPNELLFRGIEDLQLTYDIGQPPAGSPFAAGGATPAAAPACGATLWTFGTCATADAPLETATAPDWRNDAYDSANRYSGHPVNIRGVNIFVVGRAGITVRDNTPGDSVPLLGNRPARSAGAYRRTVVNLYEQPTNLLVRAHFLPPIFTNSNVGGG